MVVGLLVYSIVMGLRYGVGTDFFSYQNMYDTYSKIFTRLGLHYQAVLADTGNIGGNGSHQFMALSDIGESEIVYCDECGYAADVEKATIKLGEKSFFEDIKAKP